MISYYLPKEGNIRLTIYDLQGRQIEVLHKQQFQEAGNHQIRVPVATYPSGLYHVRLETDTSMEFRKMTVIR